jgi:DNA-binding response OmpR family regulator
MMVVLAPLLRGKRVLIVEDEALVAMLIEEILEEFGCTTIGPYGTLAHALKAIRNEAFDLAVLDVNLQGEKVYPVAEELTEQHVPFLFLSGYGDGAIPPGRTAWKVCTKPFKVADLAEQLTSVLTVETN